MLEIQEDISSSLKSIAKSLQTRERPYERPITARRFETPVATAMHTSSPIVDRLVYPQGSASRTPREGQEERPAKRAKLISS